MIFAAKIRQINENAKLFMGIYAHTYRFGDEGI